MNAAAEWIAMTPAQKLEFVRNNKPDRPDPDDPAFDLSDVMWSVAKKMSLDDVAEILGDLADANGWIAWLLKQGTLPKGATERFQALAAHAKALEAEREAEDELLNGAP